MGGGEVLKEFEIALDITRSISNREFSVVEGDTGNVLHILLTDDGEPVNLCSCHIFQIDRDVLPGQRSGGRRGMHRRRGGKRGDDLAVQHLLRARHGGMRIADLFRCGA